MRSSKKKIYLFILISVIIICIISWYNTAEIKWAYLKYNNKLYVLNSVDESSNPSTGTKLTKVGTTEKEISILSVPKSNNVSNGLPKGTEIYITDRTTSENEVVIKFRDRFYALIDTDKAENWGNGMIVRLH